MQTICLCGNEIKDNGRQDKGSSSGICPTCWELCKIRKWSRKHGFYKIAEAAADILKARELNTRKDERIAHQWV